MQNKHIRTDFMEMSDHICLFANRLISLIKYINCVSDMNLTDKTIIINFLDEIAANIKVEVENLKYY